MTPKHYNYRSWSWKLAKQGLVYTSTMRKLLQRRHDRMSWNISFKAVLGPGLRGQEAREPRRLQDTNNQQLWLQTYNSTITTTRPSRVKSIQDEIFECRLGGCPQGRDPVDGCGAALSCMATSAVPTLTLVEIAAMEPSALIRPSRYSSQQQRPRLHASRQKSSNARQADPKRPRLSLSSLTAPMFVVLVTPRSEISLCYLFNPLVSSLHPLQPSSLAIKCSSAHGARRDHKGKHGLPHISSASRRATTSTALAA